MRRRARAGRRGDRRVRALGDARDADRRGHRFRPACGSCGRWRSVGRPAGRDPRRRLPALRPRAAPAPTEPLYAAGRADARRGRERLRRCCWRCSGSPNIASRRPVFEQYDPVVQSRTVRRPERGRRRRARAAGRRGDRGGDRRQRPAGRVRSAARRGRGGVRVRRQPRLRRRRAARADQLPELRQSREAARRLAADRGGRGHRPRPARRSGSRSSAATSRCTTRRPPARSSRRRSSGSSDACPMRPAPAGWGSRAEGDADRARRRVRPVVGRLGAREAPRVSAPAGPLPPIDSATRPRRARSGSGTRSAPGCARALTTSPRAGSRWRSPSAACAGGIGAIRPAARWPRSVRRGARPGVLVSGRRRRARRAAGDRARRRRQSSSIEGALTLAVSELRAARASAGSRRLTADGVNRGAASLTG